MYENIKRAIEPVISGYGFEVARSDREGIQIFWSLYTQGSGVSFNGKLVDPKCLIKQMHDDGQLDLAARLGPMFAEENISVKVTQNDRSYTHGGTMDIEVLGPFNDPSDGDHEADAQAIEAMRKSLKEMLFTIDKECYRLIESFDMLSCQESGEMLWEFETPRFRVEITTLADKSGELINEYLACLDPDEALEEMKRVAQNSREFTAVNVSVSIFLRDDDEDAEGEWIRMFRRKVDGGIYRKAEAPAFARRFFDDARKLIRKIRSINQTLNPAQKEAA